MPDPDDLWPPGNGEMAQLIRRHDWAATALGLIEQWPDALRSAVDLILATGFPMVVLWGPEFLQLYNDAYRALLGDKHPAALGQSSREFWPEVWSINDPSSDRVSSGETVTVEDARSPIMQAGVIPILSSEGMVTEWIGAASDITAGKVEGHALHEQGGHYRTLVTSLDEGFCTIEVIFDAAGTAVDYRFLETNPAFERQTGLIDAVGKSMRELAPEHEEFWFETYGRIARTGTAERFEHEAAALGHFYNVYAFRIGRPEQHRVGILFDDIGERKQAEAALRESGLALANEVTALRRLHEASARLWRSTDLRSGLDEILQATMALVDAKMGNIQLFNPDSQMLEIAVQQGLSTDYLSHLRVVSADDPSAGGRSLRAGARVVIPDVQLDEGYTPYRAIAAAAGYRAVTATPLLGWEGQPLGMLSTHFRQPYQPSEQELRRLDLYARQVADFIERHRVEEQLRESEERYRSLFESIDEGYALYEILDDEQGEPADVLVLEVNPAYQALTLRSDAVGQTLNAISTGLDRDWAEAMASVASSQTPARFERYNADIDRWFDVYVAPAPGANPRRVILVFSDISERKRADAAVRQSEARFRTLVQNLPDYAIFLLDADGIIVEWSEGAERIIGYSTDEATGQHIALIYPPESIRAGEPERELAEAARSGRVEREGWLVRKGGERFWGNEIATAIHDDAGTLLGFTKISRDLTEQRAAAAALRASEERGRAILEETMDYAIFTTDEAGWIEDWFPGAASVFGWSAAEAVGMPFAATFVPEDRSNGIPELEFDGARQNGSAPDVRWHEHKDGTRVFIEGVVRARYGLDGEFLGVLKIGRDVTERRLAELELEGRVVSATAELRSLSRRLLTVQEEERRFLARELHDEIGQILTGLSLTLSSGAAPDQLGEAQRVVGELTEKVRQLSMDLRPAALDAYGLLPAIHSHLERYEARTGIMIELRAAGVDRRFPPAVEITAYRVVQEALTNLARYAKTLSGVVQLIADDETLFVSIRDGGFGFDPLQSTNGTGIGGMRERVELLGGRFEIEAAHGRGAAITAELPLLAPPAEIGAAGEPA